jgi:hypothetical protein
MELILEAEGGGRVVGFEKDGAANDYDGVEPEMYSKYNSKLAKFHFQHRNSTNSRKSPTAQLVLIGPDNTEGLTIAKKMRRTKLTRALAPAANLQVAERAIFAEVSLPVRRRHCG